VISQVLLTKSVAQRHHGLCGSNKLLYKPVGDVARAYAGDADAVLDYGLLIAM